MHFYGTLGVSQETWDEYEKKGLDSFSGRFLMHEYGHYLQYKEGGAVWMLYPSVSSFVDATINDIPTHSKHWAEIQASTYAYYYFGFPDKFIEEDNPINPRYISPEARKRLYNGYLTYKP